MEETYARAAALARAEDRLEIERLEGLLQSHDICPHCGSTLWHETCASPHAGCTNPKTVLQPDGTWGPQR